MYRSNKPISKYLKHKIIFCFCLDLTATQTALLLDVNRKTINLYFNKFRQKIYQHQQSILRTFMGEIELDESYFGPKRIKGKMARMGRGTTFKTPVFGVFERNGRVYTEIVPDCKAKTLRKVILGKVDPSSVVYSDSWRGYAGLVDVGYDKHFRINHKQEKFANGRIHVNGIESFWSYTKRRLTKFNGVKKKFPLHLKECEWRWSKTPQQLESELLKIIKVLV